MVLVNYIGIFLTFPNTFDRWLFVYITLFSKLINVAKWECSNQYKVNTFHYINYQDYVYLLPAFSVSIIIDSRVKIIGSERPGASPSDPRGRLHANKSIVLYNIRLHISCSYFTFSLGFFHFLFHAEAANRKQTVNIAIRGTTDIRMW